MDARMAFLALAVITAGCTHPNRVVTVKPAAPPAAHATLCGPAIRQLGLPAQTFVYGTAGARIGDLRGEHFPGDKAYKAAHASLRDGIWKQTSDAHALTICSLRTSVHGGAFGALLTDTDGRSSIYYPLAYPVVGGPGPRG
jgi:hypothetical protein